MFQLAVPELRYVLSDTRARVVVTDAASLAKVREAVADLDHVRWVVARGAADEPDATPPILGLEGLLDSAPGEAALPAIDEDDVAIMLYTSGTTGKPKGVMLTHRNLLASAEAAFEAAEVDRWEKPRISVSSMPMAHIFGVGVMSSGYLTPKRLADGYMVQLQWFDPERTMQVIQEHRCNSMPAVPTMLALILHHPKVEQFDLSSLEEVVCGAAPLPVEVARAFQERYGCRVREIYGQTESTGLGSANRLSDPYRPGSAGRAYCNTEIAIVDDDDRLLPPGERGEIALRGPTVMKGYHNRPEETARTLRGGWLHTGDVGYLDEEGFLFIVDRKKDLIIRGGENIYPAELEDILYQHPAVAEAAVVGEPDEIYGESVVAFVVATAGSEPSEADIVSFVRQRTSSFKAPSKVWFLDALPKSGVGKILRRELRAWAGSGPPAA
jgi:long-chain acyl-CoA synthetase